MSSKHRVSRIPSLLRGTLAHLRGKVIEEGPAAAPGEVSVENGEFRAVLQGHQNARVGARLSDALRRENLPERHAPDATPGSSPYGGDKCHDSVENAEATDPGHHEPIHARKEAGDPQSRDTAPQRAGPPGRGMTPEWSQRR